MEGGGRYDCWLLRFGKEVYYFFSTASPYGISIFSGRGAVGSSSKLIISIFSVRYNGSNI